MNQTKATPVVVTPKASKRWKVDDETAKAALLKEIEFVESSAKKLNVSTQDLMEMVGMKRDTVAVWKRKLRMGIITKMRGATQASLHLLVRDLMGKRKDEVQPPKSNGEAEAFNRIADAIVTRDLARQTIEERIKKVTKRAEEIGDEHRRVRLERKIAEVERTARKLGVSVRAICIAGGLNGGLVSVWRRRLNQGQVSHVRPATIRALNNGIRLRRMDQVVKKVAKPEPKVMEVVKKMKEAEVKPEPVMQALTEEMLAAEAFTSALVRLLRAVK